MRITIGQPGLFPWWGTFAKAKESDVFVHLDHVSWQKAGYLNRFALAVGGRCHWCTFPLERPAMGTPIREVRLGPVNDAVSRHMSKLTGLLGRGKAEHRVERLMERAYSRVPSAADTAIASTEALGKMLAPGCVFVRSSALGLQGRATSMLVDLVRALGGTEYLFGPGRLGVGQPYLDLEVLRTSGIRVGQVKYGPRQRCSILQDIWLERPLLDADDMEIEWLR